MHSEEPLVAAPTRHLPETSKHAAASNRAVVPQSAVFAADRAAALVSTPVTRTGAVFAHDRAEAEASLAAVLSVVLGVGGASLLLHGMTAPGSACTTLGFLALFAVFVVQVRAALLVRLLRSRQAGGQSGGSSSVTNAGVPS